jgi:hypothetical protein
MVSVRYFIGEESGNQYPNFLMIPAGIVTEELARGTEQGDGNGNATTGAPGSAVGGEMADGY